MLKRKLVSWHTVSRRKKRKLLTLPREMHLQLKQSQKLLPSK
jgi:hypothetical protein